MALRLPGGRAPTGAVYANGYTNYNRHHAMELYGLMIATRVGATSTRNVLSPEVNWMDFPRSYLDEKVWGGPANKGEPMADFPGSEEKGPAANSLVIDFTHDIARQPDSANQQRWRKRLKTIESRWGAGGTDELWCAPTAEVADYVRAAQAAKVRGVPGKLVVSLPDNVAGSALTFCLRGMGGQALVEVPPGGTLYRQGDTVVLTSPRIGLGGVPAPIPRLRCIYNGSAKSVDFPKPVSIAGVTLRVFGNPSSALPYRLAVRSATGETVFAEQTIGPGWVVGERLCPIVPTAPAIMGTGITVTAVEPLKSMSVWAVE